MPALVGTRIDRPGAVPATGLGRRHRPARAGRCPGRGEVRGPCQHWPPAMITRALDAGVTTRWVTGDEVYGADPKLRKTLEDRGIGYVLAVACSHPVRTGVGKIRADVLAASLPRRAWQRPSAGA